MASSIFDLNDGFLRKKRFSNNEKILIPFISFVPFWWADLCAGRRRTWQQAWIYLKIMWKVPRFEFKPCDDSYCFEIIQSNTRLVSYLCL